MGEGEAVRQTRRVRFLKRLASLAAATPAAAAEKNSCLLPNHAAAFLSTHVFYIYSLSAGTKRTIASESFGCHNAVRTANIDILYMRQYSEYEDAFLSFSFFFVIAPAVGAACSDLKDSRPATGGSDKTYGWRENKPSAADALAENAG